MRYLLFCLIAVSLSTNILAVRKYGLNGAKSEHEKAQKQLMEIFNTIEAQTQSINWFDLITGYKHKGQFVVSDIKKPKEWRFVQGKKKRIVEIDGKKLVIAKYAHSPLNNKPKIPLKFWIGQLSINEQHISSMLWVQAGIDSSIEIEDLRLDDLEFLSEFMTPQVANGFGWGKKLLNTR